MVDDWEKNETDADDALVGRKKKGAKSLADEEPDLTAEDEENDEDEDDLYGDDLDMGDSDE